jgi:hypothetical protein
MSRLSAGQPGPASPASVPVKVVKKAAAKLPLKLRPWRACDQCGYSKVDGQPIARAKVQVEVIGGTLYFCQHHFDIHHDEFMLAGYSASEVL